MKGCALLAAVLFAYNLSAAEIKASAGIVAVNSPVELSVEGGEGKTFIWNDSGAGGVFDSASGKVKWTAPAKAPDNNPVLITFMEKEPAQGAALSGKISLAVLGGELTAQPLVYYCDGSGPLRAVKGAANQLKNVKYQWAKVKGDDLAFTNEDLGKREMRIKALKTSSLESNNEIKLTYSLQLGSEIKSAEAAVNLTVYRPAALEEVSRKLKQNFGPDVYGYEQEIVFQVLDQFGKPLKVEGIHIDEALRQTKNTANMPPEHFRFPLNGFNTDVYGRFVYNMTVSRSAPLPDDFEVILKQIFRAKTTEKESNESIIRINEVTYKKESGDIKELTEQK